MKLGRKDLDPAIVEQLDRLNSVIEKGERGFLSFDGGNFNAIKLNTLTLNKITSNSEIEELKSHLYNETALVTSSIFTDFNLNNRANKNFKTQILKLTGNTVFKTDDDIRLIKKGEGYILILDRKGIFYKYDLTLKEISFKINIAEKVTNLFAVKNFRSYDILDFDVFRGGFLFSTRNNGIFFADIEDNNLEVLFPEKDVVMVKDVNGTDILLINSDGVVTIYDFDQELKLETFNILKKLDQRIKDVEIYDDEIILLSTHKYKNTTKNLVHILKKDLADIGYNNITADVYPGKELYGYIPMFIKADDDFIYVSGLKENKYLFIWQYDRNQLHKEYSEIIFDKIEITDLNFVSFNNSNIYINYRDTLLVINEDGEIENNIKLSGTESQDVVFDGNRMYVPSHDELSWYTIPNYIFEPEFTAVLYEGEPCNSIDIFIKGNSGEELVILLDPETLEEIQPTYYVSYQGNAYIKVLGRTIKSLIAKITVFEGTKIEGIIVKADRIFVK